MLENRFRLPWAAQKNKISQSIAHFVFSCNIAIQVLCMPVLFMFTFVFVYFSSSLAHVAQSNLSGPASLDSPATPKSAFAVTVTAARKLVRAIAGGQLTGQFTGQLTSQCNGQCNGQFNGQLNGQFNGQLTGLSGYTQQPQGSWLLQQRDYGQERGNLLLIV